MPIPPQNYYLILLKTLKSQGIKIIHRKLKNAGGLYDPLTNIITISSEFRNTLEGCYLLCHEYQHYTQKKYNEHPDFFNLAKKPIFNEELFEKILDAEMEAVKKANVMLKMFGVPFVPNELSESGYKDAVKFWREYYFGKN